MQRALRTPMRDVHGKGLLETAECAEIGPPPVQANQTKKVPDAAASTWSLGQMALPWLDLPQRHAEKDLHRQTSLDGRVAVDRLSPSRTGRLRRPDHISIEPHRRRPAALERVRHCARTNGASMAYHTRASSGFCRSGCSVCSCHPAITLDSQDESPQTICATKPA